VTEALLVLEDGSAFRGRAFGAEGEAFGEAVFNTAMSGYQEVLTDPSYAGQIVTMTSPHQGNYGVNEHDVESDRVRVAGFVVREASRRASSWRAQTGLADYLRTAGVIGVEGVDTRRLTRTIREGGAMRAGLSTVDLDPTSLCRRVKTQPGMEGADLAAAASTTSVRSARDLIGPVKSNGRRYRVAAYDYGMKWNILRMLAENACETTILPARTPPSEVLQGGFDGVFLSNGPGDPAATTYGVEAVRGLLGRVPIFAICLGHQLLSLALGGRTYKLRFGHRGVNQPVKDHDTGWVEITSHNHGFAVDPRGWRHQDPPANREGPPVVESAAGRVALTHWNLNDGTLEGLRCIDLPAFSVQYHPEAAPGPNDSRGLFRRFVDLMA
jgi:carbamoyl-phosphate synthase small subunit